MLPYPKVALLPTTLFALAAAFFGSTTSPAHADTIVSSLNNTSSVVNFSINAWAGSSFKTDAQSWTLTSATVTLELGAQDTSVANVRLMSDNGGKPGVSLADLGTITVRTASQLYKFTATNSVTLASSKTYWIVVGNVGTNGGLNVTLSQPGGTFTNTGVAGATMDNSISSGAGVGVNPPTNWVASTPGIALLFAVEGTRVGGGSQPELAITSVDPQHVYVTWLTNFTGYSLQSATNLPTLTWNTLTNAPIVMTNRFALQINPTAPKLFYRLQKP